MSENNSPKVRTFESVSDFFIKSIKDLEKGFKTSIEALDLHDCADIEVLLKIFSDISPNPENLTMEAIQKNLSYDQLLTLRKKCEEILRLNRARKLLCQNTVVSVICIYDAFLGDLIRLIYNEKIELLNGCNRQFTLSEILKFDGIDAIKECSIEKDVENVLRESHGAQFEWLEKKLAIELKKDLPCYSDFIEITERRNLFVHTGGVVSDQYVKVCSDNKVKSVAQKGSVLEADVEYVYHCFTVLFEIGVKLSQVIWRCWKNDSMVKDADCFLVSTTFDLLCEKNYDIASILLEFANKPYVKHVEERSKYCHIVNKALCFYLQGECEKTKAILAGVDFAALGNEFKLANHVLTENYEEATKVMKIIVHEPNFDESIYVHWPLFIKFIETEEFKSTYKELYKKDFVNQTDAAISLMDALSIVREARACREKKDEVKKLEFDVVEEENDHTEE